VLEEIRLLAMASFVREGAGVPILGLLYGHRTADATRITAWVPAGELRHHSDAEFSLQLQMRLSATRNETKDLECVGWMRTRNQGEPRIADEDVTLFDRCFPEHAHVTMIVRPSYQKPVKAAFYQRDAKGKVRADRPAQEFFLFPAHEGEIAVPEVPALADPRAASVREALTEPPAAPVPPPAAARPLPSIEELELLPRGTVRAFSPWLAAMLVLVGLLAGAGIAALRHDSGPSSVAAGVAPQPLQIVAVDSHWAVRWDPQLGLLTGVSGASLTITRNGSSKATTLALDALRRGEAMVEWVSDDMEVTLRLNRPGYPDVEQRVRAIGLGRPQAKTVAQPGTAPSASTLAQRANL